ncbi:MAG: ABC transporter permease [Treponema sp.]|nr:ABC transporter permease [Treponema sp.]
MLTLFSEIYKYRQMVFSLVHKELRGKYKGSVLGFFWTFLNPLLQLIVYTFVFSIIMKQNIDRYYLFLFVALVPWIFMSSCVSYGSNCILIYGDLVKKIYFPREVLPISFVTSQFVNMLYTFIVIFAVIIVTGHGVNFIALLYLPVIMIVEYFLAMGMTLLFSAITVYVRDIAHILGIVTMAWQFLTPVMYPSSRVPEQYLTLWNLNPMAHIIESYRDILYYKQIPDLKTLGTAVAMGIFFLIIGELVFSKLQRRFAENL